MSLILGIQDISALETRVQTLERTDPLLDQRITALENATGTGTGTTPTTTPASADDLDNLVLDLETLIYTHCGNDNDPRKERPALLRGNPYQILAVRDANGIIDPDLQGIPRIQLYYNHRFYDNAPADYQGGETIGSTQTGSTFYFRLKTTPNPYSDNALRTLDIEMHDSHTPYVITTVGTSYYVFDRQTRRIEISTAQPASTSQISNANTIRTTQNPTTARVTSGMRIPGSSAGTMVVRHSGSGSSILSNYSASLLAQSANSGVLNLLS